jgi:hypothetical protein
MKKYKVIMTSEASYVCYVEANTIETAINLAYEAPAENIELETDGEIQEIVEVKDA